MTMYIPPKLVVGYQMRKDTYDGKLAYVIYKDDKDVLHKEASWNNWRDQKIAPIEYHNTPVSGFVLNKGIRRYGGHFSSGRSMIRIWDQRGFEYEITPNNLVYILMETTCDKREIQGDCVYAWDRGDIVLLPCSSEQYREAVKLSKARLVKLKASELKPGYTYTTLSGVERVYLGRFLSRKDQYQLGLKKHHVFGSRIRWNNSIHLDGLTSLSSLAHQVGEDVSPDYQNFLDHFAASIHSSPAVRYETTLKVDNRSIHYSGHIQDGDYVYYYIPVGWNYAGKNLKARLDLTRLEPATELNEEASLMTTVKHVAVYIHYKNGSKAQISNIKRLKEW